MVERPRKTDYLYANSLTAGNYMCFFDTRSHRTNGASRPVTPYDRYCATSVNLNCSASESYMGLSRDRGEIIGRAYTRAFDNLTDVVVGESSSLGIAAVELGESVSMIAKRLDTVLAFAKAVKRRDMRYIKVAMSSEHQMAQAKKFDEWAERLTKYKRPRASFQESRERYLKRYEQFLHQKRRRDLKTTSGLWLEYWLGWAPTIGDVQTTLDVLAHEFPYEKVRGLRVGKYSRSYEDDNGATYMGGTIHKWGASARCSVKIDTHARVHNPNTYSANRLGVNNLLDIAWQAVPLSFLVDWKLGLSDQLKRMTALDGVELSQSSVATKLHWSASGSITNTPEMVAAGYPSYGPYLDSSFFFERATVPIDVPRYYPKELDRLSVSRATTAISLTLQLLKG